MQSSATNHHIAHDRSLRSEFDRFFAALGQGFNAYLERLSRAEEVRRLDEMSDQQLAQIGIRREEIVRHVFRDRFYV